MKQKVILANCCFRYREGMKRLSKQYRDRPMTALQSAVYWTEYVIRHEGAPHLQPVSVSLPLYQYLLLDVLALLVTSLVTTLYVTYYVLRGLLTLITRLLEYREIRDWLKFCDRFCMFKQIYKLCSVASTLLKRYSGSSQNFKTK